MPPFICASSRILDQSFPRDRFELRQIAIAFGEIEAQVRDDKVHLILTEGLQELILEFDWSSPDKLVMDVFNLLNQWFLQPHKRLIRIDVSDVENYTSHAVISGCSREGLVEIWADELGRLLKVHDDYCDDDKFFIGVASDAEFADDEPQDYESNADQRAFPLVGPDTLSSLVDAYRWEVPADIGQRPVSFRDAYKNCSVLGATRIESPSSGSHYKVRFPESRPWPLDSNVDPIPHRFLRELVEISGYPLDVVRFALIEGELPPKRLRFPQERIK